MEDNNTEDIIITVLHVNPTDEESIEAANQRFLMFQRLVENKNTTKFLSYKLHRDFVVYEYNYQLVIRGLIDNLQAAEEKIVKYLTDEKIHLCVHGEFKTVDEIFKDNHECYETTFTCYLENNLGSLTYDQIHHLYCEHDQMNTTHNQLYGCLEYEKATNG